MAHAKIAKAKDSKGEELSLRNRIEILERKLATAEKQITQYHRIIYVQGRLIKTKDGQISNHEFERLRGIADVIETRDVYTKGHSERVTKYAVMMGRVLGLSEQEIKLLHKAAHLHDIGKLYWDSGHFTVTKPNIEWIKRFREHPIEGEIFLKTQKIPENICRMVRYHHERFDGISIINNPTHKYPGYPGEISGEEIPLESRIIAVADSFDAMTTNRPYKKKMPARVAFEELKRCAALDYDEEAIPDKKAEMQFDPRVVEAFISIRRAGSMHSEMSHRVGCPYLMRADSLNLIVNPEGYIPCRNCRNI